MSYIGRWSAWLAINRQKHYNALYRLSGKHAIFLRLPSVAILNQPITNGIILTLLNVFGLRQLYSCFVPKIDKIDPFRIFIL